MSAQADIISCRLCKYAGGHLSIILAGSGSAGIKPGKVCTGLMVYLHQRAAVIPYLAVGKICGLFIGQVFAVTVYFQAVSGILFIAVCGIFLPGLGGLVDNAFGI